MTRLSLLMTPALLALLAGCGSGQATKPSAFADTPTRAASTPASTPAPAPAPQALVTDEAQNRLLVVDLPDGHVARWVPLPADPEDIAASRNGGVAVVVSSRSGTVTVLDRDTLRTLKGFGGFDQPHIVAITPDGAYAYITDDARGTLTVLRLSDMKITSTLTVGKGAHHLTISPDERRVWVALGESARSITILTTVIRTPAPPSSPVVDPGHPRVIGHLTPGFRAHDLTFSPDGRRVWISSAVGRDRHRFRRTDTNSAVPGTGWTAAPAPGCPGPLRLPDERLWQHN